MITFPTILTIGGAGIALGILDQLLKSMGKENLAMFINLLAIAGLGYYAFNLLGSLFTKMAWLFL
jgi:hypothetical protein